MGYRRYYTHYGNSSKELSREMLEQKIEDAYEDEILNIEMNLNFWNQ